MTAAAAVTIICAFFVVATSAPLRNRGLYTSTDDVEQLTVQDFRQRLYGQEHAWFMEFYVTWCGDCQRYAPKLKALATDIYGWRDLIPVGVIDCSVEANGEICRDFDVRNYPTLRYFHEGFQESEGIGVKIQEAKSHDEQRKSILEVMIQEQVEGRGKLYPNLLPYSKPDVKYLFDGEPSEVDVVVLVFETEDSLHGAAAAMDFHSVPNVRIRYSLKNNTELIKNTKINQFPTILIQERKGQLNILTKDLDTREKVSKAIRNYLEKKHIETPPEHQTKPPLLDIPITDPVLLEQQQQVEDLRNLAKSTGDALYLIDIETSMRYSFRREITRRKNITGQSFDALKNYINVLSKYFPFGPKGKKYFNDIHEDLNTRTHIGGGEIVSKIIKGEEEQVYASPPGYVGCRGSRTNSRRFPCGMWRMFHYLTVAAWQDHLNTTEGNPREVLDAMLGYVKNFLGCTDCSMHFQKMAAERKMEDVKSYKEAVLWLWKAHNVVNKRLHGDSTEDPEYPKIQFPSKERCEKCWKEDESADEEEVLEYLKNVYGFGNLRYIGSDSKIVFPGLEGVYESERYRRRRRRNA